MKQIEKLGESPIHSTGYKGTQNKQEISIKKHQLRANTVEKATNQENEVFGKVYKKCQKKNHFAKVCKSTMPKSDDPHEPRYKKTGKKIYQVTDMGSQSDSEDDLYSPIYPFKGVKQYMVTPCVRVPESSLWKEVKMQTTNSVAANCPRFEDYEQSSEVPNLTKSSVKLATYSGNNITPEGQVVSFCCYVLICMKFTLNKNIFNIQRNAACASTLNMYCAY